MWGLPHLAQVTKVFKRPAVQAGVAEVKAVAALEKGRAILKSADSSLAAEEVGRGVFYELKTLTVRIVEGENNAGMVLSGKVVVASEPAWF